MSSPRTILRDQVLYGSIVNPPTNPKKIVCWVTAWKKLKCGTKKGEEEIGEKKGEGERMFRGRREDVLGKKEGEGMIQIEKVMF